MPYTCKKMIFYNQIKFLKIITVEFLQYDYQTFTDESNFGIRLWINNH